MKKRFTLITAAVMLLTMMASTGTMWGQDVTFDFTASTNPWSFPDGSSNKTTTETTYTNGYSIVLGGGGSGNGHYSTTSGSGSNNRYLINGKSGAYLNLPAFAFPVKKIIVYGNSGGSASTKQNIFVGNTAVSTETTSAKVDHTYIINSSYQAAGNIYTLKVTNAYNTQVKKIEVFQAYTVEYRAGNHGSGTMTDNNTYAVGDEVTLLSNSFTAETGYEFDGWLVKDGSDNTLVVTDNKFTMPASSVIVTAQWRDVASDYINVSPTTKDVVFTGEIADFEVSTNQTLASNPVQFYTTSTGDVATSKPAWIGDIVYDAGDLLIEVNANTGAARTAYFRVEKDAVTSEVVTINQEAFVTEAPTFSVAAGTYYTNKSVTITSATDGASIYYTTDGTTPTSSSTLYSSPVSITQTTTLKAVAIKYGISSTVTTATYTLKAVAPTFSPVGTTYESALDVTISSSTEGATIYYTEDGSTPTTSSTLYSSAITVSETKTIKAIAVKTNWSDSYVTTATYTIAEISTATLPFSWAGGTSAALLPTKGVTAYGLGSDYAEGQAPYRVKFDDTGDFIQVKTDSQPAKVTIGVKMIGGATSSKITVKASTDGITYDAGEELTISGAANDIVNVETTRSFGSGVRYVRIVFTKGSNVGVGPIGITKYTTDPIINAPNVVNLGWSDTNNEFDYTITNPSAGSLGASSSDGWISNISTTSTKVSFETTENTSATENRTGHITLTYPGAANKIVEIVQSARDYATLPLIFDGGKGDLTAGLTQSGLGSDYDSSPKLKFDNTGDCLILKINQAATQLHFDIKGNSFSGGTFTVQWSADGSSYTDLESYTSLGDTKTKSIDLTSYTTARYIKWIYTTKSSGNVALGFIRVSADSHDIFVNKTENNLTIDPGDTYTVYSPAVLTLTGTTTNAAADLVIKDGAQLISGPVQGTMQKEITAYTPGGVVNDNWKLIASPLASASVDIATIDNYDLYVYDESTHHWLNERVPANSITNFTPGRGYLYANEANQTLEFAGQLNYSTFAGYPLSFAGEGIFKGLNLVSNPRAYQNDMWISASGVAVGNVNYLMMKADGTGFTAGTTDATGKISVLPLRGLFVQATATGQTWVDGSTVLSKGTDKSENTENSGILTLNIHGNGSLIDNAIVRLGKGHNLGKVVLNENSTKLYISQGSNEYAIVRSAAQGELPVNFKAAENGSYTLSIETKNVDLNYLHLIDKLTGNDIDLLATPEYTFSAKRGDGENRFRLVFEANGNALVTSNEPFAYFNGSEWVIENDGNATLQVIDVMGRMLRSENVSGNATTSLPNLSAGVYVLRLVNSESIRTQKVVIE